MNNYNKNILKIIDNVKTDGNFTGSCATKISKQNNRAFALPAGKKFSCPKATIACKSCYAMKGRFVFANVQSSHLRNWLLIKELLKANKIQEASNKILTIIPKTAKIFRIHTSGDFWSQKYIAVWDKIIKARPNTKFWAYTRSFHLNFTLLTRHSNFVLWASTDKYNEKEAKKFVRRFKKSGTKHAYGPWGHNDKIPKNSFICPVTSNKMLIDGACEKCMLCVVKKRVNKNVVFLEH